MSKLPKKSVARQNDIRIIAVDALPEPLSAQERKALARCEQIIDAAVAKVTSGFREMAEAFYEIREHRLYRETSRSFAAYFRERLAYGRSHANRIADAGGMIHDLSPRGDILEVMTTEAHFRPLASLNVDERQEVIDLAATWRTWHPEPTVEPALLRSAKVFLHPPEGPGEPDDERKQLVGRFSEIVDEVERDLPAGTAKEIRKLFDRIKKKSAVLAGPRSSTGIRWTEATWNPLQGCARVSTGCDRCYAAKLIATRMADMYPGLAKVKTAKDGTKSYFFANKIVLLPKDLGQPLQDRVPKRFFVNSMSDLFHNQVPDDFIKAVFEVMKKAHWHHFQVLTKRPKRMTEFTTKYFTKETPPPNIWLGTSTENQEAFDERIGWLRKTRAAVRWLSCEPLVGPIRFDSAEGIDWVVVGGESDSHRCMEKQWATDLRDQCRKRTSRFSSNSGVPSMSRATGRKRKSTTL
ncbi:MAG: phage Gp37/Gp68 family protein [Chthoniobacter sp.]|nr:phage Gp37/Gp68 family protein [Chthoniobacter sp.]